MVWKAEEYRLMVLFGTLNLTIMKNIQIKRHGRVAIIEIDRPQALNALNSELMRELVTVTQFLDRSDEVGCIVITGSEKTFAAGADIKEMVDKSFLDVHSEDYFSEWEQFATIKTPKVAAVAGYALGGGCELAMMCDIIYAAENAVFGQPEIKIGVIPGIGGTQRLTRVLGKYKAMDVVLTGRYMNAIEAESLGLVARIFPTKDLLAETLSIAKNIASFSKTSSIVAKESVDRALELSLKEGLLYERRAFQSLFATKHQKEGMRAFVEKRTANFRISNCDTEKTSNETKEELDKHLNNAKTYSDKP